MVSTQPNGRTTVALSTDLVNALEALNVTARGFGGTRIRNGVARFAITGGAADLDATRVEIIHGGGLTLRAGTTEVSLTDFVISNLDGQAVLTGALIVNGDLLTRAPLFRLQVGGVGVSGSGDRTRLNITDTTLTLTNPAARQLNRAFGITAFAAGFNIGTAQVGALINPNNGNISERRPGPLLNSPPSLFPGDTQDVLPRGKTSVTLDDGLVNALGVLNVQATGFGNTRITNGVADFLITGGVTDLDTTKAEIFHSGGLTFRAGQTRVSLTDFTISNLAGDAVLTGAVIVNGALVTRAPLFDLGIGGIDVTPRGRRTALEFNNVDVTLTRQAASTLNRVFDVSAFTAGLTIGTAEVDAVVV